MNLELLVEHFRKAIEKAQEHNEPGIFFNRFPSGQCGHTSDMLAQYLIDNGISPILYVNGVYFGEEEDNLQAHTWLEIGNNIVDITGDQFKYHKNPLRYNLPVYVGPMTEYYQLFKVGNGGRHAHFGLNKEWSNYPDLIEWYRIILKYI